MAAPFHLHLLFLLFFPHLPCIPSNPIILPLITQQIPKPPHNKLLFHHNVTLAVSIAVGTPPQNLSFIIDTGSELSWVRCSNNSAAAASVNSSSFFPLNSSTYSTIPCSSQICTDKARDLPNPAACSTAGQCHVILSYADASTSEGSLAGDTFHLQTDVGMVFGCMDSTYSSTPEEDEKNAGLLGMNRAELSLVTQMGFPRFSYCISGEDSAGVLLLGDTGAGTDVVPILNYTPFVELPFPLPYFDRVAYSVQLEAIRVSANLLPLPKSAFVPDHTGAGQTMLDTGTQFTFLLGPVYTALRTEFLSQTKALLNELPGYIFEGAMDLCFEGAMDGVEMGRVPEVGLLFSGPAEMRVGGERLLYKVSGGVFCFTFGNSDLVPIEAFVIGHHQQRDTWVEFDLEMSRVGFGDVRCDVAGRRLGVGV